MYGKDVSSSHLMSLQHWLVEGSVWPAYQAVFGRVSSMGHDDLVQLQQALLRLQLSRCRGPCDRAERKGGMGLVLLRSAELARSRLESGAIGRTLELRPLVLELV